MEKHKKTDIKYDIHVYDNRQYLVDFSMMVPADIIAKLAEWFVKKQGSNQKIDIDEFEVDERLYPKVLKGFKKAINEVELKTQKDMPGFHFVTIRIKNFKYKRAAEDVFRVFITVIGDYAFASD
jgi:hypothetical protein